MPDAKTARCRSCNAPIRWAFTPKQHRMPLDLHPVLGGNIELVDDVVHIVTADPDITRFVSHFMTCPNAAKHRRKN